MIIAGSLGALLWLWQTDTPTIIVHTISGIATLFFFLSLWFITKKKGIGLGDVKLAPLLGFLLGFPEIILSLYVAFLTGALVGVILILGGNKTLKSKIAFGPFLVLGAAVVITFHSGCIGLWNTIF
jgi:leader peptidase (prepilin peptidase)/N-methyltransferase